MNTVPRYLAAVTAFLSLLPNLVNLTGRSKDGGSVTSVTLRALGAAADRPAMNRRPHRPTTQ
jgi:hypothetical protein